MLVARSGLGTLNHTLLSIDTLRSRRIPLTAVIFNYQHSPPYSLAESTNFEHLSMLCKGVPVLPFAHGQQSFPALLPMLGITGPGE